MLSLLLTKVLRRSLRGFGTLGPTASHRCGHPLSRRLAHRSLPTEQPESTPRVSYPTTQLSTDCRIDFAVVCRVVFKVFPCGLWVGLGLPSPASTPAAPASRRCWLVLTLLSSANTRRQRYLQVPSRHHGEVRVVAGRRPLQGGTEISVQVLDVEMF